MRTFLVILLVVVLLVGGAAIYLAATTPETAGAVRFPLSASDRALLAHVPPGAEAFALIPVAAALQAKLLANPVTAEPVRQWTAEHELPRAWMLGGADIAAWKSGKTTSYAVRLDPFRALLVRMWLLFASNADASWRGSTLIMHGGEAAPGASPAMSEDLLRLAAALPEGDVLVVQKQSARGAFPPIGRPAVSSVRITPAEILLVSRAATEDVAETREIRAQFPRGAILAASFASAPRILGDLNRLTGTRIDALVDNGGSIAIYGIDTGTLIPRPRGVVVVPADEEARQQWDDLASVAALVGETRDLGDRLALSFDRESMGLYIKDATVPATWPATRWALRIDPARLVPVLRKTADNQGLRFVAPRVHRGARDLRHWIDALDRASAVEAADSVAGGVEELRVRVASK
ncbi:MAG TPA: hypothetical protein VEK11_02010 [Thermoanaerobaculia bacterium]|nr:hypothetical protein [Thermoanaerobaculia bacterium]